MSYFLYPLVNISFVSGFGITECSLSLHITRIIWTIVFIYFGEYVPGIGTLGGKVTLHLVF